MFCFCVKFPFEIARQSFVIICCTAGNVFNYCLECVAMAGTQKTGRGHTLKVILLGDGGVGKSSLMNVFVNRKFDEQSYHTIGVEFLMKDITIDKETYALQIWDTAGQERFKSLRTPFYRGADCCLLTFSLDDRVSFQNLSLWQKEFLYYADIKDPKTFPFVILGNKSDVVNRQVSTEEAQDWCAAHELPYYETSAKTAINVDTAFHAVVERARELERRCDTARNMNVDTVDLSKQPNGAKTECC